MAPLARPLFRAAIARALEVSLAAAVRHFRGALAVAHWDVPAAASAASLTALEAEAEAEGGTGDARADGAPLRPPVRLVAHPALAVLVNHILFGLNELRACAPYELRARFFEAAAAALEACGGALCECAGSLSGTARAQLVEMALALVETAAPHVAACVDAVCGHWVSADTLGAALAAQAAAGGGCGSREAAVASVSARVRASVSFLFGESKSDS